MLSLSGDKTQGFPEVFYEIAVALPENDLLINSSR